MTAYQPGDIICRKGDGSDLICVLSNGEYSHVGVCARDDQVVDAYPERANKAVQSNSVIWFRDEERSPYGSSQFRYRGDAQRSKEASEWARAECSEEYFFNILDPILGMDGELIHNNQLYCSEFVWRSYRFGTGIELVRIRDFAPLLSPNNLKEHPSAVREIVGSQHKSLVHLPGILQRGIVSTYAHSIQHSGRFVTPSQLAESRKMMKVDDESQTPSGDDQT